MAKTGAGSVTGYQSHGPERRADASHPHPATLGGTPMVRSPFVNPKAYNDPRPFSLRAEAHRLGRAAKTVRAASRVLQAAQQPRGNGGGTTWTATVHPSSGGGGGPALPSGQGKPSYGGAASNGGGNLANAIGGGSQPRALPAPPKPGPGVRVTSKPPTSQARSRAGRDRRAANFKANRPGGPKIIQGTAEDVTPAQPSGGKQPRKSDEDISREVRNKRRTASYQNSKYGMRL